MSDFRVLSEHPLNAEPPLQGFSTSFLTPTDRVFSRNHGELLSKDVTTYSIAITSEVPQLELDRKLLYDDLEKVKQTHLVAALSCAGNRRREMNEEKQVEGLQWGGTAIANSHFSGPLLRQVFEDLGVTLESLPTPDDLHVHFETTQKCEDADFYGSSLPVRMALDPERPVLLATHMGGEPLDEKHGKPCRLVVPGIIGARSVKWLERIIIRDRPSENFYMTRDYKILPPETTPDTKEEDLKHVEPMMELPLNSEICEPSDGTEVEVSAESRSIQVRGYSLGARGTPIRSVHITLVPLPLRPSFSAKNDEPPHPELHRIRRTADEFPPEKWTNAKLVDRDPENGGKWAENGKNWGWTLFSCSVTVSTEVIDQVKGGEVQVALVAFATDTDGLKQELQTPYNLRGVAEASWSVSRIKLRVTE